MERHQDSKSPSSTEPIPYAASGLPGQSPCLVDMLHRMNELDVIPQHQATTSTVLTNSLGHPQCLHQAITQNEVNNLPTDIDPANKSFPKVGRPRTRPAQERNEWHYHLGGVRHCRVPLSAELKEVLEVAYVSRIMSKNFRKEGQPEKERIAKITGMDIDKVQEWFKNRRKKDRLLQDRAMGRNLPKFHRGHKSTTSETNVNCDKESSSNLNTSALM